MTSSSRPSRRKRRSQSKLAVQVVDFFSGCGGMSYGFHDAVTSRLRFDLRGAIDIDEHANATYRQALGISPLRMDVSLLTSPRRLRDVLDEWGIDRARPLIAVGCAPCQGFSSHRKKDPRIDERNSLLVRFGTVLSHLKPDIAIMENVPEIFQEQHWNHFAQWRRTLAHAGYSIRAKIYNLAQFGVPQERFRALIIAARDWQDFAMPAPTHLPHEFVTVRDAIAHLPRLKSGGVDPRDPMHITSCHRASTVDLIKLIPPDGGSRSSLPPGAGPNCWHNVDGFRDVYGRLSWDKPAVAITARCRTPSCGRYVHPVQHRGLSVREAALLQGFPRDFHFVGPFDDKYKQIGNAVSPLFAAQVAEHLDREWHSNHSVAANDQATDITVPIRKSFSSSIASLKRGQHATPPLRKVAS